MVGPMIDMYVMIEQLKQSEGFRSYAYQDSKGFLTIGYGRLIDRRRGGGISKDEAEYLLANDISKAIEALENSLPWWTQLNEPRRRVLVDMAFNLGIDGLLKFKHTLLAIKEGRYLDAKAGMLASAWAGQVGDRAQRLADIMEKGE